MPARRDNGAHLIAILRAVAQVAACAALFVVLAVGLLLLAFGALRELGVATRDGAAVVYDAAYLVAAWLAVRGTLGVRRSASSPIRLATALAPAVVVGVVAALPLGGAGLVRVVVNLALLVGVGLLTEYRSAQH